MTEIESEIKAEKPNPDLNEKNEIFELQSHLLTEYLTDPSVQQNNNLAGVELASLSLSEQPIGQDTEIENLEACAPQPEADDSFVVDVSTLKNNSGVYEDSMRPELYNSKPNKPYVYNPANPPGLAVNPPIDTGINRTRTDEQNPFDPNHPLDKRTFVASIMREISVMSPQGRESKLVAPTLGYKGKMTGRVEKDGKEFSQQYDFIAMETFTPKTGELMARKVVYSPKVDNEHAAPNPRGPNIRFKGAPDDVGKDTRSITVTVDRSGPSGEEVFTVDIEQFKQKGPAGTEFTPFWRVKIKSDGTLLEQTDGTRKGTYLRYSR